MLKYQHLLNKPFVYGESDCYTLIQAFYLDNFSIDLAAFPHEEGWWNNGLNLFMDNFYEQGFRVLDAHPAEWRPADMLLMAIGSPVANHSAVIVEDGKILHHMPGRVSRVDDYRGLYRNNTVAVLRHRKVVLPEQEETLDLLSLLPDHIRKKIEDARAGTTEVL